MPPRSQAEADTVRRFPDFEKFRALFQTFPVSEVAYSWRDDRLYADQLVAGFDPITIRRVTLGEDEQGLPWKALSASSARVMRPVA